MANIIRIGGGGGSTPTLITKSITQNGTFNASDDGADGYSEVEVNVSGGGTAVTQFRYIKWHITANGGNQHLQISEFGFCDRSDNIMTFPQGMSATSSLSLLSGYPISNLFDGSTNTKIVGEWHSGDIEDIIIDLGSGNYLDITEYPYYYWYSSDDDSQYVGRNPQTWQIFGANESDFSDGVLLDEVAYVTQTRVNKQLIYKGLMVLPVQSGGVSKTLLYNFNLSQGGAWLNTQVDVSDIDIFVFERVDSGDINNQTIIKKDDIAVYTGGSDVYTNVYRQNNKDMNVRIYNNILYVSYGSTGSSSYQTNVYSLSLSDYI